MYVYINAGPRSIDPINLVLENRPFANNAWLLRGRGFYDPISPDLFADSPSHPLIPHTRIKLEIQRVKYNVNPYSAGIDFRRQNLTSVDVRFWRLKSNPAL